MCKIFVSIRPKRSNTAVLQCLYSLTYTSYILQHKCKDNDITYDS